MFAAALGIVCLHGDELVIVIEKQFLPVVFSCPVRIKSLANNLLRFELMLNSCVILAFETQVSCSVVSSLCLGWSVSAEQNLKPFYCSSAEVLDDALGAFAPHVTNDDRSRSISAYKYSALSALLPKTCVVVAYMACLS